VVLAEGWQLYFQDQLNGCRPKIGSSGAEIMGGVAPGVCQLRIPFRTPHEEPLRVRLRRLEKSPINELTDAGPLRRESVKLIFKLVDMSLTLFVQ
jgi:hypothetical protein